MAKPIDVGAVAEHRFAAEALSKGHMVNWPSSQMHPYDLIIDSGKACHRVQVKGSEISRDRVKFSFRKINGRKHRRGYNRDEVDYLALYLFHYDLWYIFPIDEIKANITVKPEDKKCPFRKYIDAWHLIP